MLYIQVSSKRIFIISEYWIFIPLLVAINIVIVQKLNKHSTKEELNLEQEHRRWKAFKIFNIAIGNIQTNLTSRGGETIVEKLANDYIDVTHEDCILPSGVQYVNNDRLRKLVFSLYPEKVKNGVIFITKTALCHLATEYGLGLPGLPIAVHDFINVSDLKILTRKFFASFLITIPISILGIGEATVTKYIFSGLSFLFGFTGVALTKDFGLMVIATEAVKGPMSLITRRIKDQSELVYVDLEPKPNSLVRVEVTEPYHCSLPEQRIGNPICARENKIIDIIKNYESDGVILDKLIDYDEVVNMEIVTGLPNHDFSDQFELVPLEKPAPIKKPKPKIRSRTANLLEKFGDPEHIPDTETWDTLANTKHNIRNKEL